MADCTKNGYPDQATARTALQAIHDKSGATDSKLPVRVYPCDRCEAWHLTSKRVSGRTPPWDRDPSWVRPAPTHPPNGSAADPSGGARGKVSRQGRR